MKTVVLNESGYDEAMLGLSLSYNQPIDSMPPVARKLIAKGGSHVKFLESIAVWIDVTAPRYWWSQFDTYRHVSKQSASTMHTLLLKDLTQDDFEREIPRIVLDTLNMFIANNDLENAKAILPESFLQRRIVCLNYKTLANIHHQRITHKLPQWQSFLSCVLAGIEHPEFICEITEGK